MIPDLAGRWIRLKNALPNAPLSYWRKVEEVTDQPRIGATRMVGIRFGGGYSVLWPADQMDLFEVTGENPFAS